MWLVEVKHLRESITSNVNIRVQSLSFYGKIERGLGRIGWTRLSDHRIHRIPLEQSLTERIIALWEYSLRFARSSVRSFVVVIVHSLFISLLINFFVRYVLSFLCLFVYSLFCSLHGSLLLSFFYSLVHSFIRPVNDFSVPLWKNKQFIISCCLTLRCTYFRTESFFRPFGFLIQCIHHTSYTIFIW